MNHHELPKLWRALENSTEAIVTCRLQLGAVLRGQAAQTAVVPKPSHHLVSQRGFAAKEALDILVENIYHVFLVTHGFASRVRRD